ncbi:MAG TPA: SAM-dependent methyltransferase [Terriglobales bacterium]|nr:SAM-dependent methyltransferase [Terriglobales bacterium]
MSLREQIEQEIREHGPMPFSRYMEICLYDPEHGYYSRNANQFGKAGDFYTSSDIHAVFGRLLSRQFEEMWQALDRPAELEILELGPGRGLFARDVLDWSRKKFPDFFASLKYTLQESSPTLQAKLEETLCDYVMPGKVGISKVETGLDASAEVEVRRTWPGETALIVFANEFFDALPVEILSAQGRLHLAVEGDHLKEIWFPPADDELAFLNRYSVHPEDNERIEVSLSAQAWITQAAKAIQRGFLVVVDYGYTRAEQLAGRHRGTLMAFRQHSASENPYKAPGEQDLTAHVNFTALGAAAEAAGLETQRLLTQSQFLMGIGEKTEFADAFEGCRLAQERAKVALQLKHLVTPSGMGETFHVLLASRGIDTGKVSRLSGMHFA